MWAKGVRASIYSVDRGIWMGTVALQNMDKVERAEKKFTIQSSRACTRTVNLQRRDKMCRRTLFISRSKRRGEMRSSLEETGYKLVRVSPVSARATQGREESEIRLMLSP